MGVHNGRGKSALDERGVIRLWAYSGAEAHGALLGRDAGVAAEHPAEVAEVSKTHRGGGVGYRCAAPQHSDGGIDADANQASMHGGTEHGLESRLQTVFIDPYGARQGRHFPVVAIGGL